MANVIKFMFLVLLTFGCNVNVDEPCPEPEPASVCAPVQKCADHVKGYSFTSLSSSNVGNCTFYRYACAPDGVEVELTPACEQLWETFCDTSNVDPIEGERGE